MFRSVRLLIVLVLTAAAMLLGSVQFAAADPPPENDVPPHRHFIEKADGTLVEVGPRVCGNPTLQNAFNQFHVNVHRPGAPGLHHEHSQVGITAQPCPLAP